MSSFKSSPSSSIRILGFIAIRNDISKSSGMNLNDFERNIAFCARFTIHHDFSTSQGSRLAIAAKNPISSVLNLRISLNFKILFVSLAKLNKKAE
jgi:hypothetical protein